jgi:uncharacterized protein (TIGR03083 family)
VTEPVGTPSYTELVTAVRREGETLLTAASQGLDPWVPTCEEWNVEALVEHVAGVYNNVLHLVSERITTPSWDEVPLPDGAPMDVLRELLDDLVAALADAEPDTPVWNWAKGSPDVAAFWARRMAHESSVHRFDAQRAHGIAQPIDAELAADGMDELLDVIGPRVYKRDKVDGPTGTVVLESSDNGTWCIQLSPDGVERLAVASSPEARVRGTSSALLLAAYGRIPWSSQDVEGDEALLKSWSDCMNF